MAFYKAKKSYAKAKKTYKDFKSMGKHRALMCGASIEVTNPPKEILEHLEEIKLKGAK